MRTSVVEPKVTTEELAKKYPAILVVDRGAFKLTLYKDLKLAKTYGIAVGQVGLETPAGLYHIQNKAINPAWRVPNSAWAGDLAGTVIPGGTPQNPLKARWMGIFDGAGIHGTDADRLDRQRRLARLHPDADPRRDRAVRPGAGRGAGLHRLRPAPISPTGGTSCQPCCSREAWWSGGECRGRR